MAAANSVSVDAGDVLRFPSQYSADKHIHKWSGRLDARRFAILPARSTWNVTVAWSELETVSAGWQRRWTHWYGRRAEDDDTHGKFMDMPIVRSVEEDPY